jgi:hypothetical protein
MAYPRRSHEHDSTNGAVRGGRSDKDASDNPIAPRALGLAKAAYGVGETLDLLSIGRTSLYAAVKRGDLKRVKFGKKTLFYAADLASFLTKLERLSEADAHRVSHAPGASKSTKLRQRLHRLCLRRSGADQQAIAGQTTYPFDLNVWRTHHPPKTVNKRSPLAFSSWTHSKTTVERYVSIAP